MLTELRSILKHLLLLCRMHEVNNGNQSEPICLLCEELHGMVKQIYGLSKKLVSTLLGYGNEFDSQSRDFCPDLIVMYQNDLNVDCMV